MVVGIIVGLVGLGAVVLGGLQLVGKLPTVRRNVAVVALMNIGIGVLLIAMGVLRLVGLV